MISLGVDIGTTNTKAVVVAMSDDHVGAPCTLTSGSIRTSTDAASLVEETLRLIRDVVRRVNHSPQCVGVASMAETGVPLDADFRPIGSLVRWDGQRGSKESTDLASTYGATELFAATGVRPSGKVPLAMWAYLRRTDPDRWAAMRHWAGVADLVVLALTGRLVTDHTLAGRTMAYPLPPPDRLLSPTFDSDLLAAVGLTVDQLPEVVLPGSLAGRVVRTANCGLPVGTPVVISGHDHPVGAWASGVRRPGQVADSVGTAEAIIRIVPRRPEPAAVLAAGMSLVRTVAGDADALVGGSASAGAMLAWWSERHMAGRSLGDVLAAASDSGPNGLVVLPYLNGRQCPAPDPEARPRVVGASRDRGTGALARALIDGLSLHARWILTEQADLAGADPAAGEIIVLGRAVSEGSPWLATKAAVGPAPLRTVVEQAPVATGASLLAAVRAGLVGDNAAVIRSQPLPVGVEPAYDECYRAFVRAVLAGDG